MCFLEEDNNHFSQAKSPYGSLNTSLVETSLEWPKSCVTCPTRREEYKKINNKRHRAHATEDDEPPKKLTKEGIEDYVLFSNLSGSVTPREDT
jgi:hypothetical protein